MKPPLHVDQFVQHYPRLIHARGRLIISAGMPTDQAYYLISGRAHAKSHPKLRSRMGKDFAAGDMIGFVSFLALDHYDLELWPVLHVRFWLSRAMSLKTTGEKKILPAGFLPVQWHPKLSKNNNQS